MWSLTGGEDNGINSKAKEVPSSSSPSLSSTSSSSTFPPSSTVQHPTVTRTMEEVWKDINLAEATPHHSTTNSTNFLLQDFLSRPFNTKDPPTVAVSSAVYGSPPTVLNLNFRPDDPFHFQLQTMPTHHHHHHPISHVNSNSSYDSGPFDALASSSSFGKKKFQESETNTSNDRRHKRMIKNRESAARSRARKQAYTNELELEVAHLTEENAMLKRQQEQLQQAVAAHLPKQRSLQRTSTAPF